jgi:hypothetical protein
MRMRWQQVLIPLYFVATTGLHAAFIVPASGPVPFHRANLPLDKDRLHEASQALMQLGKVKPDAEPAVLRHAAQALALASALEPEQKDITALLEKLAASQATDEPLSKDLETARSYLDSVRTWLVASKEPDALALANCISDVLDDPGAGPEHGSWKDWVADLADFTPPKKQEVTRMVVPETHVVTPPPVEPKKPQEEVVEAKLVPVIMDTVQLLNKPALEAKFVKGTFYLAKGAQLSEMRQVEPSAAMQLMKAAGMKVSSAVQFFQKTPGVSGDGSLHSRDLSGSAVVMMNACVTGVPTAATVLAIVSEDGSLDAPMHFWDLLRQPDEIPKGRLVVSEKAANYLVSTLAMNDAAFFLQHEVLLASDIKSLCDAASSEPSEAIKQASMQFAEIRQAGEKMPLGPFLSHPATVQRLRKIAEECPQHASARILLLQATNSRPRYVKSEVVTDLVKQTASFIFTKVPASADDTTSQDITEIYEKCRKLLDPYAPLIDTPDQELYKQGVELVNQLRAYSRLVGASTRDTYGYGNSSVKAMQSVQQIRAEAKKLVAKLSGTMIIATPEGE